MSTVRLYLDTPLAAATDIAVERDQAHYLFNVMRLVPGDVLSVFNGVDGEWTAEVIEGNKRRGVLRPATLTRSQTPLPDIELLFAPIKKARTNFIVEKACELGCRSVRPVFTHHTNSERINPQRLHAHMIEAAEQCGGLNVPTLAEPTKLIDVLAGWSDRLMIFCDETRPAPQISDALAETPRGTPASVLIGPEGGFSAEEVERLRGLPSVVPVSLGPRILRADTAAVAALSMTQAAIGDWSGEHDLGSTGN